LETQFFVRLGLREQGVFDLRDIPELQQSEDEQSRRDIAEINAGLKTINDVLRERGKDPSETKFPRPGATGGTGRKTLFRLMKIPRGKLLGIVGIGNLLYRRGPYPGMGRAFQSARWAIEGVGCMNNRGVIIASGAGCLAAVLRDTLQILDVRPVVVAPDDQTLTERITSGSPRLVLLENCFREEATEEYVLRLAKRYRDLRIAVWSASAVKPVIAARYVLAGAESFFSLREKDVNIAEVLRRIIAGQPYYPAGVKAVLDGGSYVPVFGGELTLREIETARLCADGKTTKEIAAALGVKAATVKAHKLHIYRKCGGNTPVDILRYGIMRGFISPEELGERRVKSEE
jgi:DNA-binding NarL/FixJ family response regulator